MISTAPTPPSWQQDAVGRIRAPRRGPATAVPASHVSPESRFDHARRLCRRGLSLLEPYGDDVADLRGRLLLDQAAVLDLSGRHDASLAPASEAHALAVRTGNRTLEGMADIHLALAHLAHMRPDALDCAEAAVAIFEEIGHDRYLNSALNNSGLVAMYLGEWDRAIECYRRAAAHGERCGNTVDRAIVEMNIGFLLYRQGRLDDVEESARRSLRVVDVVGIPHSVGMHRYLLSEIAAATAVSRMPAPRWPRLGRRSRRSVTRRWSSTATSLRWRSCCRPVRVDEARSQRAAVEGRLDSAEPPVVIAFQRTAGRLDVLDGDPEAGWRHLQGALVWPASTACSTTSACASARSSPRPSTPSVRRCRPRWSSRATADHDALVHRLGLVLR